LSSEHANLLVNPGGLAGLPLGDSLREPKLNLGVGGLDRIRSVADVPSDLDAEVTTDGAHGTVRGLGGAEHLPESVQNKKQQYGKRGW
jgi:hypothetical protein